MEGQVRKCVYVCVCGGRAAPAGGPQALLLHAGTSCGTCAPRKRGPHPPLPFPHCAAWLTLAGRMCRLSDTNGCGVSEGGWPGQVTVLRRRNSHRGSGLRAGRGRGRLLPPAQATRCGKQCSRGAENSATCPPLFLRAQAHPPCPGLPPFPPTSAWPLEPARTPRCRCRCAAAAAWPRAARCASATARRPLLLLPPLRWERAGGWVVRRCCGPTPGACGRRGTRRSRGHPPAPSGAAAGERGRTVCGCVLW